MMLAGSNVRPDKAKKIGLVDLVVDPASLEAVAIQQVNTLQYAPLCSIMLYDFHLLFYVLPYYSICCLIILFMIHMHREFRIILLLNQVLSCAMCYSTILLRSFS